MRTDDTVNPTDDVRASRRELLRWGAAGLALPAMLGVGAAGASTASPGASGRLDLGGTPRDPAPIAFPDRIAEMHAVIRAMGDLAGKPAPWWYTGYIYGVRPGEAPRKLVRFEGLEMNLFTPQPDGSFVQTGRTISFFGDPDTGEVLDSWRNPYTGQTVKVRANVLGGAGGRMVWSEKGLDPQFRLGAGRPEPGASGGPQPLKVSWTAYGPWVWKRHDRVYPPGVPQPIGESSGVVLDRRQLMDPAITNLPALFSSTYIAPWSTWMQMQGQPGHCIWHADGLKIATTDDLPQAFLERVRREYPQQLNIGPG